MNKFKLLLRAFLPPLAMVVGAEVFINFGNSALPAFLLGLVGASAGFLCSLLLTSRLSVTPDDDSEGS